MTLSIVKFGGSAITVKDRPFTVRRRALKSVCTQVLNHTNKGGRVVIVHGGGSFGHPLAMKYELNRGLVSKDSYIGVSLTRLAMRKLNEIVVREFVKLGGRPYAIEPSSSFLLKEGSIERYFIEGVEVALRKGFIPILHGDVVLDEGGKGVSILSGDTIASTLALELKADKLIYVLDVDGIYLEDPKKSPNARLINFLDKSLLEKVEAMSGLDATGGLARKIREAFRAFEGGVRTVCFVGWRGDNLLRALEGLSFRGTLVKGC